MKSNYLKLIASYIMMEDPTIQDLADCFYEKHLDRMNREYSVKVSHSQGRFTKRRRKPKVKIKYLKNNISERVLRSTFIRATRSRKYTRQLNDLLYL